MNVKTTVFWDVTLCSFMLGYKFSGGTSCLNLQCRKDPDDVGSISSETVYDSIRLHGVTSLKTVNFKYFNVLCLLSALCSFLAWLTLRPRRWSRHVPPKRWVWLSPNYMALYPKRYNSSNMENFIVDVLQWSEGEGVISASHFTAISASLFRHICTERRLPGSKFDVSSTSTREGTLLKPFVSWWQLYRSEQYDRSCVPLL
jgi:hypothetical protein